LDEDSKHISFEQWMSGQKKVIVANSSFGMGIDKSDVQYIIHVKLPTSVEEYYCIKGISIFWQDTFIVHFYLFSYI
jgi:superfamily II DNA helicase RecQ